MINRDNYHQVREYLDYIDKSLQNADSTIKHRWVELRHLLEWADSVPFRDVRDIDPSFPVYLEGVRKSNNDKPLAPATRVKACQVAKQYFVWLRGNDPKTYKHLTPSWLSTIKPSRHSSQDIEVKTHIHYTLDEVKAVAATPTNTLADVRDRAAIVFLYLSGMRAAAFLSLPIGCVDLAERKVEQSPAKGVLTKNHKAAITTLLNIPEFLEVVKEWDDLVRKELTLSALWYSKLENRYYGDGKVDIFFREDQSFTTVSGRRASLVGGMTNICSLAGIEYKSPHKLRHGHVMYGIKRAKNIEQLKAVSQNVMHSSITITDAVYGGLSADDIRQSLDSMDDRPGEILQPGSAGIAELLRSLRLILKENPELIRAILAESF